jgi:hypothetical protein
MSRRPPLGLTKNRCIGLSGANPWDMLPSVQPLNDLPRKWMLSGWVLKTIRCSQFETPNYDLCWGATPVASPPRDFPS